MILFTNCDFLQMDSYNGDGRKNPEIYTKTKKQRKNPPFGCPPIPPSIKLEADCFPGRKNRKQVGPALGGTGILIYRGKKKIKGRARYGSIQAGNMIFYTYEMFKIFSKSGLGYGLRYKNNGDGEDLEY